MLRLTDRHADRRLARRDVAKKLAQPHERRARVGRANRREDSWRVILYIINSGTARRISDDDSIGAARLRPD